MNVTDHVLNNHTLEIIANNQPTVLERMLQVTRFRGFDVIQLTVNSIQTDNLLTIKLTVRNPSNGAIVIGKAIDRLHSQLNKLFDIKRINLL
jgi:acetolactate synthase II small subunit